MKSPSLQQPAKNALATLDREFDALTAHRDYPMISLDDNASERALRRPVPTRKNAYGFRTDVRFTPPSAASDSMPSSDNQRNIPYADFIVTHDSHLNASG